MSVFTLSSNSFTDMFSRWEMRAAYWSSPMNLPLGKSTSPVGPVCRYCAHIVVGGADAQLVRLLQQHLLLHQLLADLLLKEVEDHRIVGILRAALLQLLAGNLLHPHLAHRVARGEEAAVPVGVDHGIGVGGEAPPPVRPGMRYTHMDTEAAPMMTTRSALVMRLSVCRKRIMDGLEPSTLYARTRPCLPLRHCNSGRLQRGTSRGCAILAQFSIGAIHCHYRRAGGSGIRALKGEDLIPAGCPSIRAKALSRHTKPVRYVSTACLSRGFKDQSSGRFTLH